MTKQQLLHDAQALEAEAEALCIRRWYAESGDPQIPGDEYRCDELCADEYAMLDMASDIRRYLAA